MVVIVGGGITGLAAAFELFRRGVPFTLLEASERVGGLIHTEHVGGFTIDAGADSILTHKPAALQLCDELGLGPRLVSMIPPARAYVLARGRLHALPSPSVLGIPLTWSAAARYDLLPWLARARLMLEPLVPRATRDDESIASFFSRRFGRATVDRVAQPLLGGIHSGAVEALSIHSLFPRLVEAEQRGSVIRELRSGVSRVWPGFVGGDAALRGRATGDPGSSRSGAFKAVAGGMGELVSALVRALPPNAIRVRTGALGLASDAGRWRVATTTGELSAHSVILAIPAWATARLLSGIDSVAADLCAQVPYVSTASVALGWPRIRIAHPLTGSGFVVARADDGLGITACTWTSSKWPGRAPDDAALFRAFIGSAHDRRALALTDDELVTVAARDLSHVLRIDGPPVLARVHRWPDAAPQHNVGHLALIEKIDARLAGHRGLWVSGSGFRSIGIPDCIAGGRMAADAAASYVKIAPAQEGG